MLKRLLAWSLLINAINFLRAKETFISLYAEDVRVFLPERINLGIFGSLIEQHAGYLNLFPRIIFAFSAIVDLEYVPLIVAILVNVATAFLVTVIYLNWKPVFKSTKLLLFGSSGIAIIPILGISSLGNPTYFHFQLLASSLILLASPQYDLYVKSKTLIYVITALSDPLFFVLIVMVVMHLKKRVVSSKKLQFQIFAFTIACAIQGITMIAVLKSSRSVSSDDFDIIETTYLYFDRAIGATLVPFFGFIDNSSKDNMQILFLRLIVSIGSVGLLLYMATRKSRQSSSKYLYLSFSLASIYFVIGAFAIAPETRYAIVPGIVLWFLIGYIFDGYEFKGKKQVRIFQVWILALIASSQFPSDAFLKSVDWRGQVKRASIVCESNLQSSIEIFGRPAEVPIGDKRHSAIIKCANIKGN